MSSCCAELFPIGYRTEFSTPSSPLTTFVRTNRRSPQRADLTTRYPPAGEELYVQLVVAATSSFSSLIETQHGFSSEAAVTHGRKATLFTVVDAPITLPPRHLTISHLDILKCNAIWPTTQGLPITTAEKIRRRRKRPRQSQQLLPDD